MQPVKAVASSPRKLYAGVVIVSGKLQGVQALLVMLMLPLPAFLCLIQNPAVRLFLSKLL